MDMHSTTDSHAAVAAHNVLRRAEISRLTRTLKSRLALATFKTQRGLQHVNLDGIEQIEGAGSKREIQQLQQGFVPQSHNPHQTEFTGRKRARTFDTVAVAAAKAGSVGSQLPATSMPAPRTIPNSQSVPHTMQQHFSQPPMLLTSPDSSLQPIEPQTPPSRQRVIAQDGTPTRNDQDGASLLLYLATSPGRGAMSPRTPGGNRDVNFHEYLNLFTPSPQVNRQMHLANTNIDSARKRLTFE